MDADLQTDHATNEPRHLGRHRDWGSLKQSATWCDFENDRCAFCQIANSGLRFTKFGDNPSIKNDNQLATLKSIQQWQDDFETKSKYYDITIVSSLNSNLEFQDVYIIRNMLIYMFRISGVPSAEIVFACCVTWLEQTYGMMKSYLI